MKIGKIEFEKYPLFLAPMEDVTDPAFRILCKRFGADMVYSEFISADALIRNIESSSRKLKILEEERPVAIQLYGREPEPIRDAAIIAEEAKPQKPKRVPPPSAPVKQHSESSSIVCYYLVRTAKSSQYIVFQKLNDY